MYLLSSVFKDPEMAFISYVSLNLLISINTIISTAIVYFLGELNKNDEVSVLARQRLDKIQASIWGLEPTIAGRVTDVDVDDLL